MYSILMIYLLCFAFRGLEYFILRTDQTFWGEAFLHKLMGIVVLAIAAKRRGMKWEDVGFRKSGILRDLLQGLGFGTAVFAIAYLAEIIVLAAQNRFAGVQVYVSAYAVDGNIGRQTKLIFFLICIVGNVINVVMEEGMFRGLFQKMFEERVSFLTSALLASCLFGIWHVMAPVRSYCDGMMSLSGLAANAAMLVITSGLIGFKFALLTKMTGSLYMGMGDHFVNNTIVNILHIISDTGADELQVVRITVAQSVSFIIVLLFYMRNAKKQ